MRMTRNKDREGIQPVFRSHICTFCTREFRTHEIFLGNVTFTMKKSSSKTRYPCDVTYIGV